MIDSVQRFVDGYGYLPIVLVDSIEVYRGEFQQKYAEAVSKCKNFISRLEDTNITEVTCYQCDKPCLELSYNSRCMDCMNKRDIANQKYIDEL